MTFVRISSYWLLGLCLMLSAQDLFSQGLQASARLLSLDFNRETKWDPLADDLKFPSGGGLFVGYATSRYLTFGGDIRLGQVTNADSDLIRETEGENIFAFTGAARIQHTGSRHWVKPYLQLGAGVQLITNEDGVKPCINIGGGIDVKIFRNIYLNIGTSYTREISRNRYFLDYGIGLTFALKEAQEPKVEPDEDIDEIEAANRNDFDSDGIADIYDDCPDIAGTMATNGCPDMDGDGIADHLDSCPGEAGLITNDGCPIEEGPEDTLPPEQIAKEELADTLDIAIFDSIDIEEDTFIVIEKDLVDTLEDSREPELKVEEEVDTVLAETPMIDTTGEIESEIRDSADVGVNEKEELPVQSDFLDRDGDGIADHVDRCPDEAGKLIDMGCPPDQIVSDEKVMSTDEDHGEEMTYKPKILFPTGIAAIQPEYVPLMKEIAAFLMRNEDYRVMIYGHTDNTGTYEINELLSQRRAHACYMYLQNLGVPTDRMNYEGEGQDQPLSDNSTPQGKRANRRAAFIFTRIE